MTTTPERSPAETLLEPEAPAMRRDETGALRVGSSRVLVELVLRAFQAGATPEEISQRYSTAGLADIYSVIAHYLRHREAMETYLSGREVRAQDVRRQIEEHQGALTGLRERLLARRSGTAL